MISLFIIFVFEDSKQVLYHLYDAVLKVYTEKCPEDVEDADASELWGSAPPHPRYQMPWYNIQAKNYVWVIDQARGQDGWILAKFFFCVFMD